MDIQAEKQVPGVSFCGIRVVTFAQATRSQRQFCGEAAKKRWKSPVSRHFAHGIGEVSLWENNWG
ncbi:hypothetical protein H9Q09_05585 [Aurantimonas sp. DM33-3]|nr:hypothetical protein [Aurantimonas sp. DM33-3]